MAFKPEDKTAQQAEFADAFNTDQQPAQEQSEDEAFGLGSPADTQTGGDEEPGEQVGTESGSQSEEGGEGGEGNPALAIVIEGAPEGGGENVEPAGDVETGPGRETSGAADDDDTAETNGPGEAPNGETPDQREQRLRSWEGRLKAREAGMRGESAAEEAAEQSPDLATAVKALTEDFGDEFVGFIKAIARQVAAEEAGTVATKHGEAYGKSLDEIINEINDDKARRHFEKIHDAHNDFMDIESSPEFQKWVSEDDTRGNIVQRGSARQIVKLLNDYKAQAGGGDQAGAADQGAPVDDGVSPDELAAAEGVRSSGLRLPDTPAMSQDYEDAWNKA